MFTLCLIFTALYPFGHAELLPDLSPRNSGLYSMMEFINAEASTPQAVPFSEEELIKVMTQNGSLQRQINPHSWQPPVDINDLQLLRRQYVENEEDHACAEHNGEVLDTNLLYNSWGSVCGGPLRRISCRVYSPEFMLDNFDIEISRLYCEKGFVCRQDGVRRTRFGDEKPTTSCVLGSQIVSWIIKAKELGERCSPKFRYPSAGAGKTVRLHTWSWNDSTGLFVPLKWMYVKVNGAYVKSATRLSDWTVSYDGIKSGDLLELCGTAWPDTPEVELQGQGTLL